MYEKKWQLLDYLSLLVKWNSTYNLTLTRELSQIDDDVSSAG